jgi:hypothetical protein
VLAERFAMISGHDNHRGIAFGPEAFHQPADLTIRRFHLIVIALLDRADFLADFLG